MTHSTHKLDSDELEHMVRQRLALRYNLNLNDDDDRQTVDRLRNTNEGLLARAAIQIEVTDSDESIWESASESLTTPEPADTLKPYWASLTQRGSQSEQY
ncbi:hypothetical protein [Marinobacter sp. tcs-11]|uniref:hypothetical protein n=1 Tax=Marinobacter sp. tcs-11 TaxID=1742860 RepID=UPI00257C1101|nr:hypothetical protein [Marinobacter sp. tcs-11]